MNHAIRFLSIFLGVVGIAHAVPTAINYQGRLTDGDGNPASGSKVFSLSVYDDATAGNELYSETIGTVAVDSNGIYSFQFGANGSSVVAKTQDLALADGSSTSYNGELSETPLSGTLSVTDGTYSWNEVDGNPGELATATTQLANGFVIGYAVTNGGEGYTTAPVVTINGDGIGATATAEVTNGVVTAINVGDVGSGYTNATVSIAEPPAPFVVDYSAGELTFTYEAAPSAGVEITASYDANDTSIVGALSAADSHWIELSIDGDTQSPRERVLSVPFASRAKYAMEVDESSLEVSTGKLLGIILAEPRGEQNAGFYRTQVAVSAGGVTSPFDVNLEETNMVPSGAYYIGQSSFTLPNFSASRGTTQTRAVNIQSEYISTIKFAFSTGNVSAYLRMTINYSDGTNYLFPDIFPGSSTTIKSFNNPFPNKRVSSVAFAVTAINGAGLVGPTLADVNITSHVDASVAFNLPALNEEYSKMYVKAKGIRDMNDRITVSLIDSTGRYLIQDALESEVSSMQRFFNEGDLVLILNCYQSSDSFTVPGCQIGLLELLFFP